MKLILSKPQRILMPAGSVVEVDTMTANWLIGMGAAAEYKEEPKKSVPKKAAKKK